MTIIAWDGVVLATDSKVSKADLDGHYVEGRKIWAFDQPVLFKRRRGGDLRFHAAALTGSCQTGIPIIDGITNYCRDGSKTLNEYRDTWARLGAAWPDANVTKIILVGVDLAGVPVCYRMIRSQQNPLMEVNPGATFGSGSTPLDPVFGMGLSAVELVDLGIAAQPQWCGGKIQTYHVPTGVLASQESGQIDHENLRVRVQKRSAEILDGFFDTISKDQPVNNGYPAGFEPFVE